jgi:hypothetical protein
MEPSFDDGLECCPLPVRPHSASRHVIARGNWPTRVPARLSSACSSTIPQARPSQSLRRFGHWRVSRRYRRENGSDCTSPVTCGERLCANTSNSHNPCTPRNISSSAKQESAGGARLDGARSSRSCGEPYAAPLGFSSAKLRSQLQSGGRRQVQVPRDPSAGLWRVSKVLIRCAWAG